MHDFVTLLSLALTPLTILASAAVIYFFYKPFVRACSSRDKDAVQWMILGVVIGFAGSILDNIWWGFAWSADYLDNTSAFRHFMFDHGVYSNAFARQAMGIIAGLCHISSALIAEDKAVKRITYTGCILGVLLITNLIYFKV